MMRIDKERPMHGKTVVVTGASSGIGQLAAERLAHMGARIVQVARARNRGEVSLALLRAANPAAAHTIYYADLSRLSEMKRVANEISAAEPKIDLLLNNAGAIFARRHITEEGLELTFALNHMSYFVMTLLLRARLAGDARIVNTASDAHRAGKLVLDDLQWKRWWKPFSCYGTSKLCNIAFTRELARKLKGTGVTTTAVHPGFVATRFGDAAGHFYTFGLGVGKRFFAITPEQGAETLVHAATAPEVAQMSGTYFEKMKPAQPSKQASDDELARRLWIESEKIAGLSW
jgi:NAD(P)-dependent dehydrogenase (short-subunit alcohol dehydrogenase family)